jgi:hypothetical protein
LRECYRRYWKNDPPGHTPYQVLVGPGTAFERKGLKLTWKDFSDGLATTLLVVDADDAVPWTKPVDLAYDPAGPLPPLHPFTKPVYFLGWKLWHRRGFLGTFADGKARFIREDVGEAGLRGLITRDGGEAVDRSKLE